MARADEASNDGEDSALEETAREQLGVDQWDRPLIFRDTAAAATDIRLPYWSVLVLSGGIATLGLALDNAAVVIGAMLIAPLLAPTMGLALRSQWATFGSPRKQASPSPSAPASSSW